MLKPELQAQIEAAAAILRKGGVVAIPTETVYGLAADASNPDAVKQIFEIKGRPADHPLIVHIADESQLKHWAREVPKSARLLARRFWPGPLTLVLPRSQHVSDIITGGQDTVGWRASFGTLFPAFCISASMASTMSRAIAAISSDPSSEVRETSS